MNAAAPAKKRISWFAGNVAVLCVLAPWATYWFQQHLQLYFAEIVIVGGALSLWVLVRAMWAMLEKAAKVEPWELSRRLLALPDVTGVLLVAVLALGVLWFRTASLYIEYGGGSIGEGEYVVEVVRKADGSPLIPSVSVTAGNRVVGRPFLWLGAADELECRVLRPVKFETLPCRIEPGRSTRITVPGSFTVRDFHLLRIAPQGTLYSELAAVDQSPRARYDLEIRSGENVATLIDLRRQVVYTGSTASEMPILMELEAPQSLEPHLRSQLLAKRYEAGPAEITSAVLSLATRVWPTFDVDVGDRLTLTVRVTREQGGVEMTTTFPEFPVSYTVTSDRIQTVWLPD